MKKLKLFAAVLSLLLFSLALSGCDKKVESVAGNWSSGDGYTLTLTGGVMTLTDADGADAIGGELPYYWDSKAIYVTIDGTTYRAFDAELDEDTLTLTYSSELVELMGADSQHDIVLERVKD